MKVTDDFSGEEFGETARPTRMSYECGHCHGMLFVRHPRKSTAERACWEWFERHVCGEFVLPKRA